MDIKSAFNFYRVVLLVRREGINGQSFADGLLDRFRQHLVSLRHQRRHQAYKITQSNKVRSGNAVS